MIYGELSKIASLSVTCHSGSHLQIENAVHQASLIPTRYKQRELLRLESIQGRCEADRGAPDFDRVKLKPSTNEALLTYYPLSAASTADLLSSAERLSEYSTPVGMRRRIKPEATSLHF